jgi:hypothetical protein
MKARFLVLFSAVLMMSGVAWAISNGGGNSANAPGQANAIANCIAALQKQNANGQTGAANGADDAKTTATAVTNCDHWWGNNAP